MARDEERHGKAFKGLPERCFGKFGGLGVYMLKKTMDEVTYSYWDGMNILTIRKGF